MRSERWMEKHWKGVIAALIYDIIFEPEPAHRLDQVLQDVVGRRCLGLSPEDYLAVVGFVRARGYPVANLIPQPHDDTVLHGFLASLEGRLEKQLRTKRARLPALTRFANCASRCVRRLGTASPRVLILTRDSFSAMIIEDCVKDAPVPARTFVCRTLPEARQVGSYEAAFLGREARDGPTYDFARDLTRRGIPLTYVSGGEPSRLPPDLRQRPFLRLPAEDSEIIRCLLGMLDPS